jgi:hypothetical protein
MDCWLGNLLFGNAELLENNPHESNLYKISYVRFIINFVAAQLQQEQFGVGESGPLCRQNHCNQRYGYTNFGWHGNGWYANGNG